jgi:hypothetical protein
MERFDIFITMAADYTSCRPAKFPPSFMAPRFGSENGG